MPAIIKNIEVFYVEMPLVGTFTSGGMAKTATKCVVVRITDEDGAIGVCSIDPSSRAVSPHTASDITASLRGKIAPALIGEDAVNVNRIVAKTNTLTPDQPGCAAGIELACIELICQRAGVAFHEYIGGAIHDEVLFNGWVGQLPPDEAVADAKDFVDAGFKSMKIKVGNEVDKDSERVLAIRDAVGPDINLRMDANQQCSVDQALALCAAVKSCNMQLFEQPIPKEDLEGLAKVRREGGIPIMADEAISDHESLINVIKADCADYVKFGIKQAGGLLPSSRMLATAEAAGLKVVLGHGFGLDLSTTAEIMLAATSNNVLPGLECVGPLKVVDTVAATRLDISSGRVAVPSGPGLGIKLDEEKLAKYSK